MDAERSSALVVRSGNRADAEVLGLRLTFISQMARTYVPNRPARLLILRANAPVLNKGMFAFIWKLGTNTQMCAQYLKNSLRYQFLFE